MKGRNFDCFIIKWQLFSSDRCYCPIYIGTLAYVSLYRNHDVLYDATGDTTGDTILSNFQLTLNT
jgi:hypothetical protein